MTQSFMPDDSPEAPKAPPALQKGKRRKKDEILRLLDEAVTDEDWIAIWRKIADKAKNGDMSAAKLITERKLGKPESNVNLGDGIGVDKIEFHFSRPDPNTIEQRRQEALSADDVEQVVEDVELNPPADAPADPLANLPMLTGGRQDE